MQEEEEERLSDHAAHGSSAGPTPMLATQSETLPDPATAALISVIIPHFNDLDNLDLCLTALQRQTVGAGLIDIIVADNNSRCDRTRLEAICGTRSRLIDAPIQGAAEARNAGVRASRTPLLAFIDSDCRPDPAWLEAGLQALKKAPLVGGQVRVSTERSDTLTPTEAFERIFAFKNERYVREERFSVTANLFTTREVFDRVGGFRNGVSEDVDWGHRAVALGYRWHYAPEACMEHPARRDWEELIKKWRRLSRESFALETERDGGRLRWLLRSWVILLSLPLALPHVIGSRQVTRRQDRWNALGILIRLRLWRFVVAQRLLLVRRSQP